MERDAEYQALAVAYVEKFRREHATLSTEMLDQYRRMGEQYGSGIILGDMIGDELASICDHEIAGRYVADPVEAA